VSNLSKTVPTIAALSFALAACGGAAERNETADNALTANEVGSIDNTMMASDPAMMATPTTAVEFANAAAAADMFEIESSRIAVDEATDAKVKAFAQMLITDHTKSSDQLKSIAAANNMTLSPPTMRPDMQSKLDALRSAEDAQFDQLYLSQQVPAHEEALKLHQTYAQSGDTAALKDFASKTATVVGKHLEEARAMTR
jgi:putative membrane protein